MSFLSSVAGPLINAVGGIIGDAQTKSAINNAVGQQVGAQEQIGQKNAEASNTAISDVQNAQANAAAGVNAATTTANQGITGAVGQGNQTLTDLNTQQSAALQPYLNAGTTSLSQVEQMLGPNGSINGPGSNFNFNYNPSDPGYQFIQAQALKGQQAQAAAQGGLLSGGAVRAGERLSSNLASTYLNDAFNRALQTYTTNRQNTLTQLSGLQGLTNLGYNATGLQNTNLGNLGSQLSNNLYRGAAATGANTINAGTYAGNTGINAGTYAGNTTLEAAKTEEQAIQNAANAQSGGILGKANANNALIGQLSGIGTSLLGPSGPLSGVFNSGRTLGSGEAPQYGGTPGAGYNLGDSGGET